MASETPPTPASVGDDADPGTPAAGARGPGQRGGEVDLDLLEAVQRRVLWLATRIVDAANRERDTPDGVKVGGHQASSASLVTVMTALWFAHLRHGDRVSVKPHASPTFHAVQYLLGHLDRDMLTRLRARGGLQAYPSRTKDPDGVDFSTGSVGLGAVAPLFAAVARRYVDHHHGPRPRSRFIALVGDAELDEGNVWEAIAEPATHGLGDVTWIIDVNRQSLDRVVPGVRVAQWEQQFAAAGWHVTEVKYGRRLRQAFAQPGGEALRDWIDALPNEHYQALFGQDGPGVRELFLDGAPAAVRDVVEAIADDELPGLLTDLGGHDLADVLDALRECDAVTDRPSVVFAYTVKGWGLPIAGDPRNHAALLSASQIDELRAATGLTIDDEWDRFDPASRAGVLATRRGRELSRPAREILGFLPREEGNPYVFPGRIAGTHRKDFKREWDEVRRRANLEDITFHDLRRTAGSHLAQAGVPLLVIQRILGHQSPAVTRVYARLGQEEEREALEALGEKLSGLMGEDTGS